MDSRFDEGITLFNREEFFDAHEVWEDLWHEYRGEDRTFLQGLIQAAAGLYHAQCGNTRGAVSQLSKAVSKLGVFVPFHRTVNTGELVLELTAWRDDLLQGTDQKTQRRFPTLKKDNGSPKPVS